MWEWYLSRKAICPGAVLLAEADRHAGQGPELGLITGTGCTS